MRQGEEGRTGVLTESSGQGLAKKKPSQTLATGSKGRCYSGTTTVAERDLRIKLS